MDNFRFKRKRQIPNETLDHREEISLMGWGKLTSPDAAEFLKFFCCFCPQKIPPTGPHRSWPPPIKIINNSTSKTPETAIGCFFLISSYDTHILNSTYIIPEPFLSFYYSPFFFLFIIILYINTSTSTSIYRIILLVLLY